MKRKWKGLSFKLKGHKSVFVGKAEDGYHAVVYKRQPNAKEREEQGNCKLVVTQFSLSPDAAYATWLLLGAVHPEWRNMREDSFNCEQDGVVPFDPSTTTDRIFSRDYSTKPDMGD